MNTFISVYCNSKVQRTYQKVKNGFQRKSSNTQASIIIGTFLLLSVLGAVTLAVIGNGYLRFGDIVFHYNRLMEFHDELLHGHLSLVTEHVGYPQGSATNVFYPWLTWLPFVIFTFISRRPLTVFYLSFIVIVFLRFLISYYSYGTYDRNRFHCFIFSILYTANASVFYWMFLSEDIGASLATDFLPLVLFGYLAYLKRGRWLMLTTGLVLVFYSHLVTALLSVVFIGLLLIFNIKQLSWRKFGRLWLAVIVTIILTAPQMYLMMKLALNNQIMVPGAQGIVFGQGLFTQLGVSIPFAGILLAFSRHWRLTYLDKQLLVIGIFCYLINASLIGDTVSAIFPLIRHLQFSVRFCTIEYLVFPFLIMEYMKNWSADTKVREHQSFIKFMVMTVLLIMPCIADFNSARQVSNYHVVDHQFTHDLITKIGTGRFHATFMKDKISGNEIEAMAHRSYYMDYMPVQSSLPWQSFIDQKPSVYRNGHFKADLTANIESKTDGVHIENRDDLRDVQLPIIVYHGLHYDFTLNGSQVHRAQINRHLTNLNRLLVLKRLSRGQNTINIKSVSLN